MNSLPIPVLVSCLHPLLLLGWGGEVARILGGTVVFPSVSHSRAGFSLRPGACLRALRGEVPPNLFKENPAHSGGSLNPRLEAGFHGAVLACFPAVPARNRGGTRPFPWAFVLRLWVQNSEEATGLFSLRPGPCLHALPLPLRLPILPGCQQLRTCGPNAAPVSA